MARYMVEEEHTSFTHYFVEAESEQEAMDKVEGECYDTMYETGIMHSEVLSAHEVK